MQHELHGREVVPPPLWRIQRVAERHHAEWEEPAELRAICPPVRKPLNKKLLSVCWVTDWVSELNCFHLLSDDGLSNSQAHIALNDHTSLFHETKEHLDGSVLIFLRSVLHFPTFALMESLDLLFTDANPSMFRSRQRLGQRPVSGGRPERLLRFHSLLWQRGWGGPPPARGMLGKSGIQCRQQTPTTQSRYSHEPVHMHCLYTKVTPQNGLLSEKQSNSQSEKKVHLCKDGGQAVPPPLF